MEVWQCPSCDVTVLTGAAQGDRKDSLEGDAGERLSGKRQVSREWQGMVGMARNERRNEREPGDRDS